MELDYLKKNSFTSFIEANNGNADLQFYAEVYEENPQDFKNLTTGINSLLDGKIAIESIDLEDESFEIKTNKGNRKIEFDSAIVLGLRGSLEDIQLLYFRMLNDVLLENGFEERLVIYYDELIPNTHWIGLIKKTQSHFLLKFISESNSENCKDFAEIVSSGPRVLGIGVADEDIIQYSELVIFP
ncbi:hypothetical protein I2486_21660 [Cellulophaga sp. E16_2]|uniref:hypothetical protein n=1 Tax=unclassified Cellulophaga TaxID=2634405 RepID=UPI0013FD3567|nr:MULTISPECIES: hypothetical protein [unclassified Cellulophaga]MBO0594016.1 hypothetical protein [Cellulophaga sp. E16_2]